MEAPEKTKDQPPNRIFLQFYGMDADDMTAEYGDEWCEAHETSYCVDQIYDTDIEYTHTMPGELVEALTLLVEYLDRCGNLLVLATSEGAKTIRDILAWHEGKNT